MMRHFALPALVLLAGCGTSAERPGDSPAETAVKAAVQTATLTGLYEGGNPAAPSQLCIVDRAAGNSRFGLVVRDPAGRTCSGAGGAVRQGEMLRLEMAGDEPCLIEARIEGLRLTFPATLAPTCSYYCAPEAAIGGTRLVKVGGTAEDALRARDPVGDPLCAGMATP